MKNSRPLRRALLTSTLAIMMCLSMLVGTTFAWFTDSVSSGVNTIQSGNLKLGILHDTGDCAEPIDNLTKLFDNINGQPILWEPGASVSEIFYVRNLGNLALKYQFKINFTNATRTQSGKTLADVLTVSVNDGQAKPLADLIYEGVLLENSDIDSIKVTIAWPQSDRDNEYNVSGGLKIDLGVSVLATQYTYEYDGFSNTYDQGAGFFQPITAAQLAQIMTPVNGVITLEHDYRLTDSWTSLNFSGDITVEGNGHIISGLTTSLFNGNAANNLTIKNLTIADSTIASTNPNYLGNGAFISWMNATGSLKMDNCHAVDTVVETDSSVSGAGALVGYVDCAVTEIKNCSVTNCTVNSTGSAGGILGHAGTAGADPLSSLTISNCTITNTKISSSHSSDWRVGEILGTINGGTGVITGCTTLGNKLSQGSLPAPNPSHSLYGRKVGSASLSIDGTVM